MRFERTALILLAAGILLADFFLVLISSAANAFGAYWVLSLHTALLIGGLGAFGIFIHRTLKKYEAKPIVIMGRGVATLGIGLVLIGALQLTSDLEINVVNGYFAEGNMSTVVVAGIFSIALAAAMLTAFQLFSQLLFLRRRKMTKRNYQLLLLALGAAALTAFFSHPNGVHLLDTPASQGVLIILLIAILINSFRLSWIIFLTRKEKLLNLLFTFFGILTSGFILFQVENMTVFRTLMYFHPGIQELIFGMLGFTFCYLGIGFFSTLLHLPTSREFDKKQTELTALQGMGRLMTQVLDANELTATASHLALDMAEAEYTWIELIDESGIQPIENSMINVTKGDIALLQFEDGQHFRELPLQSGKALFINDIANDRRIRHRDLLTEIFGSFAILPLSGHGGKIGLLCIGKKNPFEFDADALTALYALADMVSIAVENNRLIEQSIEKERLQQELLVAQQMQRALLPQSLPASPEFDIAATSIPAYEVGGDYYDFVELEGGRLGFIIGDVSGKGASAALYMAQVKGIFQTLSVTTNSPSELIVKMNASLVNHTEKKYFVSLLYGILDINTGTVTYVRSGHCPPLYISDGNFRFEKPNGMALGLTDGDPFLNSIEETRLELRENDILVLYTDGITEAKNVNDEEFDTSRLSAVLQQSITTGTAIHAQSLLEDIISNVENFTTNREAIDDMTVLLFQWKGNSHTFAGIPKAAPGTGKEIEL